MAETKKTKKTEEVKNTEKFAVIKLSGVQLKVFEGKVYEVNKLVGNKGDKLDVTEVLLVSDGENIKVGTPFVEGATVSLELASQKKGEKINGFVYRAKSRHRRRYGYRSNLTNVFVKKIS